jgi:hypothetical protein
MGFEKNSPTWAIITGACGGLGTSFAISCARRGYNLLLLDITNGSLERLSDFMGRNFPVRVDHLNIDLSEDSAAERVAEKIRSENLPVSMLINNAGLPMNELFERSDAAYLRKMLEVNGIAPVSLTHALLPELKKNRKSHIINVSSLGGYYALPRKSVYSAIKGFVRLFSQALRMEVGHHGVSVSILCPGGMTTNISNYVLHRQLGWLSQRMLHHPQMVAEVAVRQALKGKEIIIPGGTNRILKFVGSLIPGFVVKKLATYSMKKLE